MRYTLILLTILLFAPLTMLRGADGPTKHEATRPLALTDLPYAEGGKASQSLDLYLPATGSKPAPLLLWIHGGGWREGDKRGHPLRAFAEHGFAIASMNYRLTGEAPFPAQIDDVRAALKWLRAHAAKQGYDGSRIGVIGHSAGGQLSALLGVSSLGDQALQAVCVLSGPSDMQAMVEAAIDPNRRTAMESLFGRPLKDKSALRSRANRRPSSSCMESRTRSFPWL
jgi:acetyl esterase/lipase